MKYLRLVVIIATLPICLHAQIKINSPYQKKQEKDKTYIPDEGQETQSPPGSSPAGDDIAMVKAMVSDLFLAMNQSDANKIKSLFAPEGRLMSTDATGKINILSVDQFAQMIGQAVKGSLEERVTEMEVKIDANLATVWAEYDFLPQSCPSALWSRCFSIL
ncbi:MAG: nuclear transport factor 2 family protein [Saprospiraceae bacterium]|nr:nuclear transport factor 2 family protein [Saprospiraceae bacterium]